MDKIQKIIDTCSEQAQELIDFGNSREQREGYGMKRVIDELIAFKKEPAEVHIIGNGIRVQELARYYLTDHPDLDKTNLEKLHDPSLIEEMVEYSKGIQTTLPEAKEFTREEIKQAFEAGDKYRLYLDKHAIGFLDEDLPTLEEIHNTMTVYSFINNLKNK